MIDTYIEYTLADVQLAIPHEIWGEIPGYEGRYQASTYGRIMSMSRHYETGFGAIHYQATKFLKPIKTQDGYLKVALSKEGIRTDKGIHRVVGETFLENPENKPEINHKNLDKHCNYLWNLEWNTFSENRKHAFEHGANDIRKYNNGTPPNMRLCIDIETGIFYQSLKEAAIAKCINRNTLEGALAGRFKNKTSIRYA